MNITTDFSGVLSPTKSEAPKEMLSWSRSDSGQWKFKINFSSLSIMQECWQKVEFSLVRGLRPRLESPATIFGSAIHKGLEIFYSGKRTERIIPSHYRETMELIGCGRWESDWESELVFRAARAFVLKAQPLTALADDNKRSIVTGVWMLSHYFLKYHTDEYVILEDAAGPIVERFVTMNILDTPEAKIDLFGTVDAVLRSEVTGQVLGCDHKTSSMLHEFYSQINPNHQYTGYVWAINKVLGIETDGFLVNALEVKPPPKTSRGTPPNFARQVTTRTEEDFSELLDAISLSCMTFAANLQANTWPKTAPGPCSKYGGCNYLDVCAAPRSLRENIIGAKYAVR